MEIEGLSSYIIDGYLEFDPTTNVIVRKKTFKKTVIKLEPRLSRVLYHLLNHPNRVCSRKILMAVNGSVENNPDEALTLTISRLRRTLLKVGVSDVIQTIPRIGYQFTGEVKAITKSSSHDPSKKRTMAMSIAFAISLIIWGYYYYDEGIGIKKGITDEIIKISTIETSYPSWSPDGKMLAIQSNRNDDNSEIYTIGSDGLDLNRLTDAPGNDEYPSISPDGKKIAFTSTRDGTQQLYVMNMDGSDQRNVSMNSFRDIMPRWSRNGENLLFSSDRSGNLDVYILNIMNGSVTRLTDDKQHDKYASWSPTSDSIVFVRVKSLSTKDQSDIYIMDLNTLKETPIVYGSSYDGWPSWSAKGTEIFFASDRNGDFKLYYLSLSGNVINSVNGLTNIDGKITKPFEAPDGSGRLAMTLTRSRNVEILILQPRLKHLVALETGVNKGVGNLLLANSN